MSRRLLHPLTLAAFGFSTGVFDAVLLRSLGLVFTVGSHDATAIVGLYFGISFAGLGLLLGYVIAGRRRDAEANRTIAAQLTALQAAQERLAQSEKLAALGQLAASIAHEVRNPLAVIRSATQELAETAPSDANQVTQASRFVLEEIDRLNNVISSLLTFARPPQLNAKRIDLTDILTRAIDLSNHQLRAKHIRVDVEATCREAQLYGDPDLLTQAFVGLLSNAASVVPPDGRVTVAARRQDAAVEVDITDSGPGVPVELRKRIFEPFFTTRSEGTGLGLAIIRQIIEAHAGSIQVTDSRSGACFRLRLPAAAASLAGA